MAQKQEGGCLVSMKVKYREQEKGLKTLASCPGPGQFWEEFWTLYWKQWGVMEGFKPTSNMIRLATEKGGMWISEETTGW